MKDIKTSTPFPAPVIRSQYKFGGHDWIVLALKEDKVL